MELKVVTVLELIDTENAYVSVNAFTDDDEGNRQAEKLMFTLAKENGYVGFAKNSDEFMEEEGDCWQNNSGYIVLITHS